MIVRALLAISLGYVVVAFTVVPSQTGIAMPMQTTIEASHTTTTLFGGAQGGSTTREGKSATVDRVKSLLNTSEMIFTVPASSLTVSESQLLRRSMPENTTICVVKNTLMNRALEGTEFQGAAEFLKGANMWFFIEDDISGTIKAYKEFLKEMDMADTHTILGGVLEGTAYDPAGVEAIGKLPSKIEMYSRIARLIKAVPTRLARVIKAPSVQLAVAIKLATDEINKSNSAQETSSNA